jgi:phosphatidylinositol-bisphosphatase
LDCLDRTNLCQTVLGIQMLDDMLTGLCESAPLGERKMLEFRRVVSDMWLTNGDNVSRCITGTGAISGGVKSSKLKVKTGGRVGGGGWTVWPL